MHKAFLRYHDPNNWPLLREALKEMGRADLIGNSKQHLIPTYQPKGTEGEYKSARKKNSSTAGDSVKRNNQQTNNHSNHKRPQKVRYLPNIRVYLLVKQVRRDHLVAKVNQNPKLVDNDKKALKQSLFYF